MEMTLQVGENIAVIIGDRLRDLREKKGLSHIVPTSQGLYVDSIPSAAP
jgi:hypothetical protein